MVKQFYGTVLARTLLDIHPGGSHQQNAAVSVVPLVDDLLRLWSAVLYVCMCMFGVSITVERLRELLPVIVLTPALWPIDTNGLAFNLYRKSRDRQAAGREAVKGLPSEVFRSLDPPVEESLERTPGWKVDYDEDGEAARLGYFCQLLPDVLCSCYKIDTCCLPAMLTIGY